MYPAGDSDPQIETQQPILPLTKRQPPSSGGLNKEIIAAADANSDLYPRYYRRAMGFTVFGESCFDVCEPRDG